MGQYWCLSILSGILYFISQFLIIIFVLYSEKSTTSFANSVMCMYMGWRGKLKNNDNNLDSQNWRSAFLFLFSGYLPLINTEKKIDPSIYLSSGQTETSCEVGEAQIEDGFVQEEVDEVIPKLSPYYKYFMQCAERSSNLRSLNQKKMYIYIFNKDNVI